MPSLLIHRGPNVYDVSPFLSSHPGGSDCILALANTDISLAMTQEGGGHEHSEAAWEMMEAFRVWVDPEWEAPENFVPEDTDTSLDFKRSNFLDLSQPLLGQLWRADRISKAFYLSQVHQPRHLPHSARLFNSPLLEAFTKTAWFIIPSLWLPIALFIFYLSSLQFSSPHLHGHLTATSLLASWASALWTNGTLPRLMLPSTGGLTKAGIGAVIGVVIWTLLEYGFHRFLFHLDSFLPNSNKAFTIHFLLHGVHHYLPMDPYRLVMPPIMFFTLQLPMTTLAHAVISWGGSAGAWAVISGAFLGYVCYDCFHYASHHMQLTGYLNAQRKYHLEHHYKNYELGFGVTSRFWDWLFNTTYAAAPRAMSAVSGRRNPKGEGAVKTVGAGGAEKGEQCVMGMEGGRKVAALIV